MGTPLLPCHALTLAAIAWLVNFTGQYLARMRWRRECDAGYKRLLDALRYGDSDLA